MEDFTLYGSMFLIGVALALAGGVGVLLPSGNRAGVLLALLAGIGVGIASLAVITPRSGSIEDWWRVFFISSIVGFVMVVLCLVVAWRRSRPTIEPVSRSEER